MEVYAVVWSSSSSDDNGNAQAFSGIHGIYKSEASAKVGLEECKQEIFDEVANNPDYDEDDKLSFLHNVQVYGSVEDGYFEVDYTNGDTPVEMHMHIINTHVQN